MTIARARVLNALVLLGVLALFVSAANQIQNDYIVKLIMLVGLNVILAVSLTVASGFTGVFSLGQIGFMAIGAYVGALISLPLIWKDPILLPGLPRWPP